MSAQHFDPCDDAYSLSIRVQTTLNHIRFVKFIFKAVLRENLPAAMVMVNTRDIIAKKKMEKM